MRVNLEEMKDEALCREQLDLVRAIYEKHEAALDVPMVEKHPGLLAYAAGEGSIPVVEFLIEEGYPVNPEPNKETGRVGNLTPLGIAAWNARAQSVEYLLSKGADVHLLSFNGLTPLEIALDRQENGLARDLDDWKENYKLIIEMLKKAEGKG